MIDDEDALKQEILEKLKAGEIISPYVASQLGKTAQADKRFPFRFMVDPNMTSDFGHTCNIYDVKYDKPKKLVAKVFYDNFSYKAAFEWEMMHLFRKRRRKVPKAKGIFNIYNPHTRSFEKALVMEKIEGETLEQMIRRKKTKDEEFLEAATKAEKELRALKEIGNARMYSDIEEGKRNIIINPLTKEITIIDFGNDEFVYKKYFKEEIFKEKVKKMEYF